MFHICYFYEDFQNEGRKRHLFTCKRHFVWFFQCWTWSVFLFYRFMTSSCDKEEEKGIVQLNCSVGDEIFVYYLKNIFYQNFNFLIYDVISLIPWLHNFILSDAMGQWRLADRAVWPLQHRPARVLLSCDGTYNRQCTRVLLKSLHNDLKYGAAVFRRNLIF